jgi:hypothetical protein
MEMATQSQASRVIGGGPNSQMRSPELIGRPSPLEGVGGALRAVFDRPSHDIPDDFQALLDKLR